MASGIVCLCALTIAVCVSLANGHSCNTGWYGVKCRKKCGRCIGGPFFCDSVDGFCANGCSWGYTGNTCHDLCPDGTWGYDCMRTCSPHCVDPICGKENGNCSYRGCKPGYVGPECAEACIDGMFGQNCSLSCNCTGGCGCDPSNGTCYDNCEGKMKMNWGEEIAESAARWKRQAASSTGKPATSAEEEEAEENDGSQMMCSKMKSEFKTLKKKLNNKVNIPFWPLFLILFFTLIIMLIIAIYDLIEHYRREKYMAIWERENLDKPLAEAAEAARKAMLEDTAAE